MPCMPWDRLRCLLGICLLAAACTSPREVRHHDQACDAAPCGSGGGRLADAQTTKPADDGRQPSDDGGVLGSEDDATVATGPGKVNAEPDDEANYVFDQ